LYGYLLSILSSLPKTIETLTEHLPILGSALLGDRFRTSLAAEAFMELWTVYSDVVEPRKGWPAGLVKCLTCAGQPTDKTEEVALALFPSSSSTLCDDASDKSGKQTTSLQDETYE
jgi:hypothetical protein